MPVLLCRSRHDEEGTVFGRVSCGKRGGKVCVPFCGHRKGRGREVTCRRHGREGGRTGDGAPAGGASMRELQRKERCFPVFREKGYFSRKDAVPEERDRAMHPPGMSCRSCGGKESSSGENITAGRICTPEKNGDGESCIMVPHQTGRDCPGLRP